MEILISPLLQVRLKASRALLHGWQNDEHKLLSAFTEEHNLLGQTGRKLDEALGCYRELMVLVERNQQLMKDLTSGHGIAHNTTTGALKVNDGLVDGSPILPKAQTSTADAEKAAHSMGSEDGSLAMKQHLLRLESEIAGAIRALSMQSKEMEQEQARKQKHSHGVGFISNPIEEKVQDVKSK